MRNTKKYLAFPNYDFRKSNYEIKNLDEKYKKNETKSRS